MTIHLKRAYDPPAPEDGARILVDRLWPRGVTKEKARIDLWLKEIAPSDALRKWFGHEPAKWPEFQLRYLKELEARPAAVAKLAAEVRGGPVTLVYAARDEEHNNAVALKEFFAKARGKG